MSHGHVMNRMGLIWHVTWRCHMDPSWVRVTWAWCDMSHGAVTWESCHRYMLFLFGKSLCYSCCLLHLEKLCSSVLITISDPLKNWIVNFKFELMLHNNLVLQKKQKAKMFSHVHVRCPCDNIYVTCHIHHKQLTFQNGKASLYRLHLYWLE